ncbi:hypothetical protein [Dysgonomonas sp. ZJ279]|uniref:hypothetical protein n=1 Tax=Dysgonomonas sp. ZJ279 TaxID=2709796 RepID=UPI0013EAD91A|nr:hypothetical protein [Dysgonomonas sp. ZJ279]
MKIKRIILSTIFVAGIIVASTSCSQTDEMGDGGETGGRPPESSAEKKSTDPSADKANDSKTHRDFEVK